MGHLCVSGDSVVHRRVPYYDASNTPTPPQRRRLRVTSDNAREQANIDRFNGAIDRREKQVQFSFN